MICTRLHELCTSFFVQLGAKASHLMMRDPPKRGLIRGVLHVARTRLDRGMGVSACKFFGHENVLDFGTLFWPVFDGENSTWMTFNKSICWQRSSRS
jgi:hypothetical protein